MQKIMYFNSTKKHLKNQKGTVKPYRTEQMAHYFLRLSLQAMLKENKGKIPSSGLRPFITSDLINHWLYLARLISEDVESYVEGDSFHPIQFDEDVVRRFKKGVAYDEQEIEKTYLFHVAFASIDEKWKAVPGSLIDFLLEAYRAEGYERNKDWSGFENEHLPIDLLVEDEKKLLQAIWEMIQDESQHTVTTMILQSLPYKISKIQGEKIILQANT